MPGVRNRASDEYPLNAASMLGTDEQAHTVPVNREKGTCDAETQEIRCTRIIGAGIGAK
jgi:hypothetical protein